MPYCKRIRQSSALLLLAAVLITGCTAQGGSSSAGGGGGGEGGGGNPIGKCLSPISGGGTTATPRVSPSCILCTVADQANVIDADADNFGQINLTLGALLGEAAIRVTAQPGVVFGAGGVAGATVEIPAGVPASADAVLPAIIITTFLGATQTNQFTFEGLLYLDVLGLLAPDGRLYFGGLTTAAFDSVEVAASPGVAGALTTVRVFNACSDGEPPDAFPGVASPEI